MLFPILMLKQSILCGDPAWRKTCKQNSLCVGVAWQTQSIQHLVWFKFEGEECKQKITLREHTIFQKVYENLMFSQCYFFFALVNVW